MQVGELLVKIGTDLTEYRKGLAEAQKQAQGFASTIKETLKNAAGVALGMAGFQGITATIKNTIGAGINLNAQLEQNRIAFQVLTGSAAQAKKIVQDLYQYSASTPFEFPGVVEAGRALQTVGLNVKETIKWVGDLAAANPQATIEEVARAIARLKSGDFGEAFERLRDFGISRKMLEGEGLVFDKSGSYKGSVEQALAAVENIVKKRYGGMAEAQSKTFSGMLSTLRDNLNMVFGTALEPVFNRIKQALPEILDKLSKFSETFKSQGVVAAFKEIIPPGVVDAVAAAGRVIKDLFGFITAHGNEVVAILAGVGTGLAVFKGYKAIESTIESIKKFREAMIALQAANPILLAVSVAIGVLAFAAYEIYKHWDGIKKFFSDLWKGIKDTVTNAANSVVDFLKKWGPLILAAITGPIGLAVYEIAKHWNEIKAGIATAWAAIKGVAANAVNNVVSAIKTTFARVRDIARDALAWGRNIVEGLWQGIKSAIGWFRDRIREWVGDVTSFLKRLFKISSPSGVTREIGQQVAAGLAVGITDGTPQVLSALDAQIAAAEAKLKEATARLNAIQEQQARTQQENERKNLEQEVANADARVKLTEGDIALLRKKLAEYQKHGKDVSSVLQQIAEAEQRLTQDKQKAAEARTKLAEYEAKAQVDAAQKEVNALKEQQKVLQDYKKVVTDYYAQLDAAREEYEKKVTEINAKLAQDEQKLTEEYEKAVADRAKSLRDFVGLFDEVNLKNVTGEQLLKNLRQQVEVFRKWQENLRALAARGVDEGLIAELRDMGPKAAAEIAALNTLSDEQLSEYVALWRQKNADARAEAERQLTGLAAETQAKIAELRANAAAQLEQYRLEWQQKNEEIKQNTINTLKQIVEEASKQGAAMVAALAAAITTAMPELTTALAGLPGFAPAGGKDQVAQAQQQKTGVVQAAVEQKQGVTDANLQTVTAVLQMWTDAGVQMAVKQDEIKTKTLTTWQQIQQQLSVLWQKMLADVKKTWDEMRKYLFDVTKQVEDRFTYLVNAANNWGVNLMSNFIAGIWSQFDRLQETLQTMAEIVDSYMPHSPAKQGPLSRLNEWGPALVRELTEGIRRSLPSLEEVTARMAALSPGALAPAIATSYNTSNAYYGGNTIYIQVSGGNNASDLADQLMRELRKRGVRL